MEREPRLESRAQLVIAQADEVLTLPDSVHLMQRYNCHLGGDFFLEVRSTADTSIGDSPQVISAHANSRYIYLSGSHEEGNCRPAFSINLNKLTGDGEVSGLTDGVASIQSAIDVTPSNLEQEKRLLTTLLAVMHDHDAYAPVDPDKIRTLETVFIDLLDQGATMSHKFVRRTNEDGTKVIASSQIIEGSLQHVWPHMFDEPRVRIGVYKKDATDVVVLEESREGIYETFEEIADPIQRMAAYAKEEDIKRDDDGKIVMVSGTHPDVQAIKSAERAMGIRDLHSDQLAVIEAYVRTTLIV